MTPVGSVEPFRIHVADAVLDDLRGRLARARLPDQIEGTGWDYGIPTDYLRVLLEYWRDEYDWRAQEARLNELEHFRTGIDGQSIHFIHARSPHADALPLLLVHGWPGSVVEFLEVIPRLTRPEAFGGDARDAFHVVVPSLPGYGFSEATRTRGWDVPRIARAFIELMGRLDYARYGAQGGDWGAQWSPGSAVSTRRTPRRSISTCRSRTDRRTTSRSPTTTKPVWSPWQRFQLRESAYALEQGTKPQTLGAALNDSPIGLLAWIVEKFRTWSDCDGDPERVFTRDQLITNVMLYWVTQTATSAARLYWEHANSTEPMQYVEVPTGVTRYPREILRFPRAWVERGTT